MNDEQLAGRIELDPLVCAGKPVIRGTRIPVSVILDHVAEAHTWEEIVAAFPELTREDVRASIVYAKASIDRTDIVPASSAGGLG